MSASPQGTQAEEMLLVGKGLKHEGHPKASAVSGRTGENREIWDYGKINLENPAVQSRSVLMISLWQSK